MTETLVVSCLVLITTYFQDYMMQRMLNIDEKESHRQPK
jgi:hypothetical protein